MARLCMSPSIEVFEMTKTFPLNQYKRMLRRFVSRTLQLSLVLLLCGLCNACGMNLRPAPVGQMRSLAGSWQVTKADRDKALEQLRAAFKQADDKQAKRDRKMGYARWSGGLPPADSDAAVPPRPVRENWEVREHREQEQGLIDFAVPPESFKLTQSPTLIEIAPNAGARRSFVPGEPSTLVTTFGSFRMESGWQQDEFVVHSHDAQESINLIERYRKQADGSLSVTVAFKTGEVKEQTFKLIYTSQP